MTRAAALLPSGTVRLILGVALSLALLAAREAGADAVVAPLAAGIVVVALEFVLPPRARPLAWAAGGAALLAAVLAPDAALDAAERAPALLPAIGFGTAAWWFARSLLPGREPLIVRWNRHDPRRDAAASAPYARALTRIWAVSLGAMTLASLAPLLPGGPGAGAVALVNQALMALLFLGEHVIRAVVFRDVTWPTDTLRAVLRAEWPAAGTPPARDAP